MSNFSKNNCSEDQEKVIAFKDFSKTPSRNEKAESFPVVWPAPLRAYLREQITSARDRHERAAAVRLASELAAR